jgi:regulator of cell morphogenesis and NO signaling
VNVPRDLDPERSLGTLVAEQPGRAQLFEQLRLDYCCGGRQTLAEACAKRGLDLDTVCAALRALDAADRGADIENTDWRATRVSELCEHIVAVHHDGLRDAFPRIEGLLRTVVRVHGAGEPHLHHVKRLFDGMRGDLESHMASEESELFPACLAWERSGTPVDEGVLSEHEHEHGVLGEALTELRGLCHGYDRAAALCDTHQTLLDALEAFEQDLHRHVHEENNILLPRVTGPHRLKAAVAAPLASRSRPTATLSEPTDTPLPCCQAWIAEQTHRWTTRRR